MNETTFALITLEYTRCLASRIIVKISSLHQFASWTSHHASGENPTMLLGSQPSRTPCSPGYWWEKRPSEWLFVIFWATGCGTIRGEPSSPTFSTFEEKSLHSCSLFYCLTFPVSAWSR